MLLMVAASLTCSKDDEHVGQPCQVAGDCYPALATPPHGDVMCLTKVPGGYCTHLCQIDADCCAVQGECKRDLAQVCGPFESTGLRMCFMSCEAGVLGGMDANAYCDKNAHVAFICRSTGGGAQNRQVCVPNG
jgi:hypothetical protein